ncbi:diguanylate phosphodiesterase [Thiocapsa imhoffii]|uniref:Diguanylate phosphodiesterase n=1 Tax=Thiocapsa imhoffii TaxID=382777 RepID=A0A9X0WKG3_9GAMM|nr:EAL domain-containing protein [Thiocapsa imhoffii]MBK1646364.1 diguanylate phosphodiesterase [Thiocapsa imhoffii]
MTTQHDHPQLSCDTCANGAGLDFDFTMAFQPIVKMSTQEVYAYESLARGLNNEPAGKVFERVNDANRYRFDQACRVKAVKLAAELSIPCFLSINFMPNAVYRPELCIRTTLAAAAQYGFPIERIIFEITESEEIEDRDHMRGIVEHYAHRGLKTAIDDFGAGYAGLNLLADVRTDIVKLDMALIRDIHKDRVRQIIVKGLVQICADLQSSVIAEGVETKEELLALQSLGIDLFQGYYFAKPAFQSLPAIAPGAFNTAADQTGSTTPA